MKKVLVMAAIFLGLAVSSVAIPSLLPSAGSALAGDGPDGGQ